MLDNAITALHTETLALDAATSRIAFARERLERRERVLRQEAEQARDRVRQFATRPFPHLERV